MRINQFLSHNTKFSRREADNLVQSGRVKINRKVAALSDKVGENDRVFIDSRQIKPQNQYTIIAYNKPKGELVSRKDDRGRRVIFDSLEAKFSHFTPVGRLDFASSGLLILSDSVKIATALTKSDLVRIYNVKVSGKITDSVLSKILDSAQNGLSVADARAGGHKNSKIVGMDFAPFAFFEIVREGKGYTKIKVGINEGQNRELRRFFAHFGLEVVDLVRVSFGFIHLNALPCGKSRFLNKKEYKKVREFLLDSANAESNKNQSVRSTESRPLRGAKNWEKGCSSATADFLLEAEKRGSPPKSEKRQLLARRGSGAGGAALLREKAHESKWQNDESNANSNLQNCDSDNLTPCDLDSSLVSLAQNDESMANSCTLLPQIEFTIHILDFPGFGYAKVSKSERDSWDKNLSEFLKKRESIKLFIHLIDSRHTDLRADSEIRAFLQTILRADADILEVFTKADKLKKSEIHALKGKILVSIMDKNSFESLRYAILQTMYKI